MLFWFRDFRIMFESTEKMFPLKMWSEMNRLAKVGQIANLESLT